MHRIFYYQLVKFNKIRIYYNKTYALNLMLCLFPTMRLY